MTTAAISVTLGTALTGPGGNPTGKYASTVGASADAAGLAVTADAAVATVQTDINTVLTDYDIFGAALVAITGDTYSAVTHQWTTGGSTGLTHTQVATLMALLNTTATAAIAAKTAATTAKAATAAATGADTADATLIINQATVTSGNALRHILQEFLTHFANFGIVAGQ